MGSNGNFFSSTSKQDFGSPKKSAKKNFTSKIPPKKFLHPYSKLLKPKVKEDVKNSPLSKDYPFKLWKLEWSNLEGKCLDGSSGGYYYKEGSGTGSKSFILYLEGGGWCYDSNEYN